MPEYYKCSMSKIYHLFMWLAFSVVAGIIVYLFYHIVPVSVVLGTVAGIPLEKMYADSTIKKKQRILLLQFRDFLDSMNVAASAGNVEYQAIRSALGDLRTAYADDAYIVREVQHIIDSYEKGGKQLKELFLEFGQRSGLADIKNFAQIYSAIEGRSDNFGAIVSQTAEIIGDKIEIEQEIMTEITSAKSETNAMLIMPIIVVVMMGAMGGGLMDALFTTVVGRITATVALVLFLVSYIIAKKSTDIKL